MLSTAEKMGIDLLPLALTARNLAAHEVEQHRTWPSPRREELDALVAEEMEMLCGVFVKLERAVKAQ
jgi:hypothetical protein